MKIVVLIISCLTVTTLSLPANARGHGGHGGHGGHRSSHSKDTNWSSTDSGTGYQTGPRGGCYKMTSNGKKKYVNKSYCQGNSNNDWPS